MRRLISSVLLVLLVGCSGGNNENNKAMGDAGDSRDSSHMQDDGTPTSDASTPDPDRDGATPEDSGNPGEDAGDEDANNPPLGACGEADGQLMWPDAPWNSRVDQRPTASDSDAVIAYLAANQTAASTFQIDYSLTVLHATASTPYEAFTRTGDHYSPDCDLSDVPVPAGGALEGEDGYACESDGDCHLIVVAPHECRLYEMWRADIRDQFRGGCLAVWETDRAYPETLRGDYCTSADAAGLPIAPLLVTPDEVAAGEIRHALRFILPNARIRSDIYVRPGTHSTRATSGPAEAPPYSGLLRLKSDVDLSGLNPAQQTVARALQQYGMYLADGGNITFTFGSDHGTQNSWSDVGLGPHDMKWLEWTDFELVDAGAGIAWSGGDCQRTPVTD